MRRTLRLLSTCLLLLLWAPDPALGDLDTAALQRALTGPDREVTDFVRDAVRKPVEVLDYLGIEAGMTVLDVYAAGGYYTFILSKAVGEEGTVYTQNTERGLRFVEDRQNITQGEALQRKIDRGQLLNVVQVVAPLADMPLAPRSLDAIMLAQTLHDWYNGDPQRAVRRLSQLYQLLKPGGVLGVTDHVGLPGYDNGELHRMEIEQAVNVARQAGFLVDSNPLLRNPADDHARSIFDPRLNRNTDRFLLKLTRPD